MKTWKPLIICLSSVFFLLPAHGQNSKRCLLVRDEGIAQLSYIDTGNPKANWYSPVPAGRDMQLVGNGKVLIGTISGYEEHDIKTGNKVNEITTFTGTIAARRLRNGNTILVGLNWQGKEGIVLVEIDDKGITKRVIAYPGFDYVRLVRETASGTFLVTSNDVVFEGDETGKIIWRAKLTGPEKVHAWQALRLANGNTVVSCGFAANFQVLSPDGKPLSTITGPAEVRPYFYAGFQILANGNMVVANWQGHGADHGMSGFQVLEYTPSGQLVWSWKQDPEKISSLQGVIVLDDLDLNLLQTILLYSRLLTHLLRIEIFL